MPTSNGASGTLLESGTEGDETTVTANRCWRWPESTSFSVLFLFTDDFVHVCYTAIIINDWF